MMNSRSRHMKMKSPVTIIRWLSTAANVAEEAEARSNLSLYRRLSALGLGAKKGLVKSTINEYVREGRSAPKDYLVRCIKELRRFGKYHQALEVMEWMDARNTSLSFSDHAIRLDLISKVKGIAAAQSYFNHLQPPLKNKWTYGALLNCYCVEKMKDQAFDLFDKMDELKIEPSSLSFNNLMSLCMRLGEPQKVPALVQQMKNMNVQLSTFTYNIWMTSYSSLGDLEGVERVFEEVKQEEGQSKCDWTTYSNLAVAYVKAGLHDKAELALKRLEQETRPPSRQAFHFMLSLYASISNLGEVHRTWNYLKSSLRAVTNISYLTMLQALSKLNDIDGLKKCFEEWESACSSYDIRLANAAIAAFLRHGMADEAEAVLRRAIERSSRPLFASWEMLMVFYLDNREVKQALRCLEDATSTINESEWHPSSDTISKFLSYFQERKDIDGAEELCKHLKKVNCLDHCVYKSLLQTYIAAGRTAPNMRTRMEGDGIEIGSELESLLQNVCVVS